jgi:hypothetical protein
MLSKRERRRVEDEVEKKGAAEKKWGQDSPLCLFPPDLLFFLISATHEFNLRIMPTATDPKLHVD